MRRPVNGVLLLDKPAGISSNHALQAAKRIFQAQKAGHAGTLDPLASGLLPVLLGEATRFAGYLLDADKRYEAEIRLGITTRTGDAEGEVLERRAVDVPEQALDVVLGRFLGAQMQVPPMHSALKRDGTPLYVLARRGETVERLPRAIRVFELRRIAFDPPSLKVLVVCSKGTYVRTLAEDIGKALGCGAHLAALRRMAAGGLSIAHAVSLDALAALGQTERDALLRPADAILDHLPRLDLDAFQSAALCQGRAQTLEKAPAGVCRAYAPDGRFLGLASVGEGGRLAPKRLLGQPAAEPPTG